MSVLIVKQMILANGREKDIDPAVIIIVTNGSTHAIETDVQPSRFSGIRKLAAAVILVQRHSWWIGW
jgi:hypothetical protein